MLSPSILWLSSAAAGVPSALCVELRRTTPDANTITRLIEEGADPTIDCGKPAVQPTVQDQMESLFLLLTGGMWIIPMALDHNDELDLRQWPAELALASGDRKVLAAVVSAQTEGTGLGRAFSRAVAQGQLEAAELAAEFLPEKQVKGIPSSLARPDRMERLIAMDPDLQGTIAVQWGPEWAEHPQSLARLIQAGLPASALSTTMDIALQQGRFEGLELLLDAQVSPQVTRLPLLWLTDDQVRTKALSYHPDLSEMTINWWTSYTDVAPEAILELHQAGAPDDVLRGGFSVAIARQNWATAETIQELTGENTALNYNLDSLFENPEIASQLHRLDVVFSGTHSSSWPLSVLDAPQTLTLLRDNHIHACPLATAALRADRLEELFALALNLEQCPDMMLWAIARGDRARLQEFAQGASLIAQRDEHYNIILSALQNPDPEIYRILDPAAGSFGHDELIERLHREGRWLELAMLSLHGTLRTKDNAQLASLLGAPPEPSLLETFVELGVLTAADAILWAIQQGWHDLARSLLTPEETGEVLRLSMKQGELQSFLLVLQWDPPLTEAAAEPAYSLSVALDHCPQRCVLPLLEAGARFSSLTEGRRLQRSTQLDPALTSVLPTYIEKSWLQWRIFLWGTRSYWSDEARTALRKAL